MEQYLCEMCGEDSTKEALYNLHPPEQKPAPDSVWLHIGCFGTYGLYTQRWMVFVGIGQVEPRLTYSKTGER